jgi:hypothetical protein
MDWVWQPDQTAVVVPLTVTAIYQLEQETGMLLTDLFRPVEEAVVTLQQRRVTAATRDGRNYYNRLCWIYRYKSVNS